METQVFLSPMLLLVHLINYFLSPHFVPATLLGALGVGEGNKYHKKISVEQEMRRWVIEFRLENLW